MAVQTDSIYIVNEGIRFSVYSRKRAGESK